MAVETIKGAMRRGRGGGGGRQGGRGQSAIAPSPSQDAPTHEKEERRAGPRTEPELCQLLPHPAQQPVR